ncbi:MAG: glucoamylase family protein [Planctomycetota bacterium]
MSKRTAARGRLGLSVACAVWLAAGATVVGVPPRVSVIMVDDFDGEPNSVNQFFGARALLHPGCGDQMSVVAATFAGKALRLIYDHTTCDSGWTTRLDGQNAYRGRDLSDAITLSFRVRGVVSTTQFRVRLTDAWGASATANITDVTSSWSEKTVDLTTAFPGVDRTQLTELAFVVPDDYSSDLDNVGTLYFDEIYLQTDAPEPADDNALLEEMAYRCFRYFWDLANPTTGFAPDRATNEPVTSIAGLGYQLAALPIGVDHGWVTREEAAARAMLVLQTLATKPQRPAGSVPNESAYCGYHGFYYHMLDSTTGLRVWTSELSSIDSTLLYLGVINALVYFDGPSSDEGNVRAFADLILDRVDWPYMYDAGPKQIWMEWKPETGFAGHWDVYTDEVITMTLLAAGSTTHPVPLDVYYGWRREQRHYTSYAAYASWTGTQFTYYQAQNWLDLTDRTDQDPKTPVNWLRNAWSATRGERQFAMDKSGTYSTYGPDAWGMSDSTVPGSSYYSPLSQPRLNSDPDNDNGTIPCAAAGATLTFFYGDPDGNLALAALRHYYEDFDDVAGIPRLWRIYGLVDAYNTAGSSFWYSNEFICLGQGALLLSIENYLSNYAVGRRAGAYAPLAEIMDVVFWPAGDVHDLIYAREAEQWDAHSPGGGMTNEYHPEASGNYTFQLGYLAGNNVTYVVKNFWEAGRNYRLEMNYSEDVAGNIVAVEWDGVEIGRFTTQDSGGWLYFITSPSFAIGPVGTGEHTLYIVNTNGGTYGVNLDVIRIYAYQRGDVDGDGTVDLADYTLFSNCMTGPGVSALPPGCTAVEFDGSDLDGDDDVDLNDFGTFQEVFAGP